MSPISLRVQVAQVQAPLLPKADVCRGARDLARHKGAATTRALVVEKDTVARIHAVRLPVVLADPERVQLCNAIRGARVERRVLVLRDALHEPVQLRSGRLVEAHVSLESARPHSVEQAKRAEPVDVAGVLGHLERDLDVRLRAEIVDFGRLDLGDDVHQVGAIGKIAIVELEFGWAYEGGKCGDQGQIKRARDEGDTHARVGPHKGDADDQC